MMGLRTCAAALACLLFLLCLLPFLAHSQTTAELQQQIDQNNAQIEQLNKEIAQFEAQLNTTTTQKKTLQNKIGQLDLQRKQLQAKVNVTTNQMKTTQLQIQQLANGIASKQSSIEDNKAGLAESLRLLNQHDEQPLSLAILSANDISDAWTDVDTMASLQEAVRGDIQRLAQEQQELSLSKADAESKRALLEKQQQTLNSQKGSLDATRKTQSELLTRTKSQEAEYQKLLAQKQAAKANFESALQDLKSQLQYTVDPSQITAAGKGVLKWPMDNVRVTQYFGNTPFAQSGAYAGKGHNGIDLAASIGTPLKAAASGVVLGTGNTDNTRGCYSFGKWVMIKHNNGLNTMYAHLSEISVSTGQSVASGQVVGYSGETGYATGPHLHFGVYVSSATKIMKLGDATNRTSACSGVSMPITPLTGYLNPLNYL